MEVGPVNEEVPVTVNAPDSASEEPEVTVRLPPTVEAARVVNSSLRSDALPPAFSTTARDSWFGELAKSIVVIALNDEAPATVRLPP